MKNLNSTGSRARADLLRGRMRLHGFGFRPFARLASQVVCVFFICSIILQSGIMAEEVFIAVGAQVVVYRNATVTQNEAIEVLDSANVVFANAKANLYVRKTRFVNDEPAPNGTNSICTEADRQKIYKNGLAVLKDFTQKRLMLTFVERPDADNGFAIGYCGDNLPVSIVQLRMGTKETGVTAAHEFCHSFGLDDVDDKTNLMHKNSGGRELKLTAEQIQTIRKRALPYDDAPKKKPAKTEPATPKPKSSGLQFDPESTNPAAPNYLNIAIAGMSSDENGVAYDVFVALMGLLPSPGAIGSYRLLFDTDDDPLTGITMAGHAGIEKVLRVDTLANGLILFRCQDLKQGSFTPVVGERISLVGNLDYVDPSIDVPEYDAFYLTVPKSLLNLTGKRYFNVPVVALQGPSVNDDFHFTLDLFAELAGPQLYTETGQIGPNAAVVTLIGSNFTPNADVGLLANQILMDTVTTDANGSFTAAVTVPGCTAADVVYLWGVESATTLDAFTVVNRIPTACDANCDGVLDVSDIPPFVDLILDLGIPCNACSGDANSDGTVDALDIPLFLSFVLE